MPLRERHQILVEIEAGHAGRRVRRIANDQRNRLRDRMNDRPFDGFEELRRRLRRHRADDAARHQKTECMDRVAGVRAQHHVTWRGDRLGDVGEAFLRPQRGDDLGLGVELDAKAACIIARLSAAQPVDAL